MYPWVVLLKDKKVTRITTAFQKVINESRWKPNKTLINKGSKFCNKSMKLWLQNSDIEMYSTHNEEKLLLLKDLLQP